MHMCKSFDINRQNKLHEGHLSQKEHDDLYDHVGLVWTKLTPAHDGKMADEPHYRYKDPMISLLLICKHVLSVPYV